MAAHHGRQVDAQRAELLEIGRQLSGEGRTEVLHREIKRLLRIRDKKGEALPLTPNRAQAEYSRCCGQKNIVLKARQMGITTWIAARFFIGTVTAQGMLTVQVAHDQRAAEEIFRIVHRFWANLPEELRTGALRTSRANVRQIVFPVLDSEYRVETAADAEAGRGLTIQNLHASEVARWPRDAAATLASLRAAVPPEGEIVLESTPNGARGCFYEEWRRAGESGYVRHFFPWWWEPAYTTPSCHSGRNRTERSEGGGAEESLPENEGEGPANSVILSGAQGAAQRRTPTPAAPLQLTGEERDLQQKHRLTDGQISFRRQLRANFRKLTKQEFAEDAESCFLASGECVFEVEAIDSRLSALSQYEEAPLQVFAGPLPGRVYIIGADPAGGGSEGDYCCAQVIDRQTGLQCAELHGRWPPYEFSQRLERLGRQYNDALIAVESNNHGSGVLAHLGGSYPAVFEHKGSAGVITSVSTRSKMVAMLTEALMDDVEMFNSRELLAEMRSFVRKANGRAEAAAGAHDDRVMALGVALFARSGH